MPSSRAWRHAIASAAKADAASKFILTLDPTGASHLFGEESRLKMPYGSGNERALVQRLPCCKGNDDYLRIMGDLGQQKQVST
ncbi:uncharacterized protein LOC108474552 isoform X3 [Gossypium arboreum]|uniref:uncharacterized protein LOC108474552 isoform X3 n=1 Tax=Gossypium arboreum TaxID=29729 RepID=UPI0022F14F85|nr:uncharacterized protein LOC108474552 isoform X3 [Gossypium arboreum]